MVEEYRDDRYAKVISAASNDAAIDWYARGGLHISSSPCKFPVFSIVFLTLPAHRWHRWHSSVNGSPTLSQINSFAFALLP